MFADDKFPDDYILQRLSASIAEKEAKTTLDHFEYPFSLKNHFIALQDEFNLYDLLMLTKSYDPKYIKINFVADKGIEISNVRWETPEEEAADEVKWKQTKFAANLDMITSLRWAYEQRVATLEKNQKD